MKSLLEQISFPDMDIKKFQDLILVSFDKETIYSFRSPFTRTLINIAGICIEKVWFGNGGYLNVGIKLQSHNCIPKVRFYHVFLGEVVK